MNIPLSREKNASGFTLIELLTVIAIIGVLAGITIPVISSMRDRAKDAICLNNLRQVGMAMNLYAQDNKGQLPVKYTTQTNWVLGIKGYLATHGVLPKLNIHDNKNVLVCGKNLATAIAPVSNDLAYTCGMNDILSQKSLNQITNQSQTCLVGDGKCKSDGKSWELIIRPEPARKALPINVHNNRYHFVYVDSHVAALLRFPANVSDVFWQP
ncbi:prepilin-type N-terminal cleavage/methylation domain-containing protein [Opitutaceae bacterium TAV1]|nr:prepilin-type N-terminal cleavage/methylation domain-containing protein [Opitutaceae bacterium TAV1]